MYSKDYIRILGIRNRIKLYMEIYPKGVKVELVPIVIIIVLLCLIRVISMGAYIYTRKILNWRKNLLCIVRRCWRVGCRDRSRSVVSSLKSTLFPLSLPLSWGSWISRVFSIRLVLMTNKCWRSKSICFKRKWKRWSSALLNLRLSTNCPNLIKEVHRELGKSAIGCQGRI